MLTRQATGAALLCLATGALCQQIGTLVPEVHPKLQWTKCTPSESPSDDDTEPLCRPVHGEITVDAQWRWAHKVDGWESCYRDGQWDTEICPSNTECAARCALEGVDYARELGIVTTNANNSGGGGTVSLNYRTNLDFAHNLGSRVFLMENKTHYQTFHLPGNEIAFDVDVSTVDCGVNAAFTFVAMDADGGLARWSSGGAGAGAEYGTGYCDARCSREQRWIAGGANAEGWIPHAAGEDPRGGGYGGLGACCGELAVLDSNSHSVSMSSHLCPWENRYSVCEGVHECGGAERGVGCDVWGCDYNPFRMGVPEFYGRNKSGVDSGRAFTVVTRFAETGEVTKFFVQDGARIEMPPPRGIAGLPEGDNGLTRDMCDSQAAAFEQRDKWAEREGWKTHLELLGRPLVLALSIDHDYWAWNTWLDSTFPPDSAGRPGGKRGDCYWEDNEPLQAGQRNYKAKAVWSNIRFGPIGSTVKL